MGTPNLTKSFYLWTGTTLLVGVALLLATTLYSAPKGSDPKISWAPSALNVTVPPGISNTIKVSFVATKSTDHAVLWVAPELESFVQLNPQTIGAISEGQIIPVDITVTVSPAAISQRISGTIHLRNNVGNGETFPSPLPIDLTVAWNTGQLSTAGVNISFKYPLNWTEDSAEASSFKLFSPVTDAILATGDAETPADITLNVLENPSNLSLQDFLATYRNGWYSAYNKQIAKTIAGHEAILLDDRAAAIPSFPGIALFVSLDSKILLITGTFDTEPEFNALISTLTLN